MNFADQWATIQVLWARDVLSLIRRPIRMLVVFVQPVIFWLLIGGGLTSTFRIATAEELSYEQYFYPGILVMMVLFASIFGTITVIEDRHTGFLQSILVAPGSRTALVLGKSLGVSSVGLIQAVGLLALLPLAGFSFFDVNWLSLLVFLGLGALSLSTFGFALAWWLDSSQAYHAIMTVLLLPGWALSGAVFPLNNDQFILSWIMRCNPMSYIVDGVRRSFYQVVPEGTTIVESITVDFIIVLAFTIFSLAWATIIVHKSK